MTIFPCGAKGSDNFCPDVCQYGKFCKIKDKKVQEQPRGFSEEPEQKEETEEELDEKDFKIETY